MNARKKGILSAREVFAAISYTVVRGAVEMIRRVMHRKT